MTGSRLMDKNLKANLTATGNWKRLIYMILFAVAFQVAEFVILLVTATQFLLKLFTGKVNERLGDFGHALGIYVSQLISFWTYRSDDMPFPFAAWPAGEAAEAGKTSPKPSRRRKAKPKKAAAKAEEPPGPG